MSKEDLKVKIGSKEQVMWERVLKNAEVVREQAHEQLLIQEEIIKLAKIKILSEKQKL